MNSKTLDHLSANAKAYIALLGSVCTALLGIYTADSSTGKALTAVLAVCTALGTWTVPNTTAPARGEGGAVEPGSAAVGALVGAAVVWFLLRH